jgi:hypothetical protein
MLINVDISTGVMYQPGLINLCLSFLGQNDPLILSRNLNDRRHVKLARFLAGIRVETRDASRNPGSGASRARVVRKLTQQGASDVTFVMHEGRTMTVARYFQDTTGQPLQFPGLLCVEVSLTPLFFWFTLFADDLFNTGWPGRDHPARALQRFAWATCQERNSRREEGRPCGLRYKGPEGPPR